MPLLPCCPPQEGGLPYLVAAFAGDLPTLERLRRLGCPLPRCRSVGTGIFLYAMCPGARGLPGSGLRQAPLQALGWLLDAGVQVDWEAAVEAARDRDGDAAEVEEWLRAQREQRSGGAALRAVKRRRLEQAL